MATANRIRRPVRRNVGGTMKVTVAPLSQEGVEITISRNATLATALQKAGFPDASLGGIHINGEEAKDMSQRLKARDFVTVTPNVQGGSK